MSDTASNYVPFTVPSGSVIVNPTLKNSDGVNLIVSTATDVTIGAADVPWVEEYRFYATADGAYQFGFGTGGGFVDWRITADGLFYGGTQIVGPPQPNIATVDGTDLAQTSGAVNSIIAALIAHGLIAQP